MRVRDNGGFSVDLVQNNSCGFSPGAGRRRHPPAGSGRRPGGRLAVDKCRRIAIMGIRSPPSRSPSPRRPWLFRPFPP
jgi:hypothetical protein